MYRFCTRLVLVVAVTSLLATSTTAFAPSRTGSTTTTTTGIIPFNTPATAKRRRRNALACFAQKNTVRGAPTQSFAVSVDSSEADDAIVTEPSSSSSSSSSAYLTPPAVVVPTTTGLALSDQYHHHHKDYEALVPKILNALLLTLAFGSAIYAIINVDSGMTRGWTQSVSTIVLVDVVPYHTAEFFYPGTTSHHESFLLAHRKLPCAFHSIPGVVTKWLWKKSLS